MNVIFLDIDGVICTADDVYFDPKLKISIDVKMANVDGVWMHHFSRTAVAALNHITDVTGAKLVISSTWRNKGLDILRIHFKNEGVTGEIIDKTPFLLSEDKKKHLDRGLEIQDWLDRNQVKSFVILDDDSDMAHLMDRLVKTLWCDYDEKGLPEGLTMAHAEKAIELLGKTNESI